MKTAYRNTLDYKEEVARKCMKSLYEISKLLCAQECKQEVTNMEHQAVAIFFKENYQHVFAFLDVDANEEKAEELKKLYCSENGIETFPTPNVDQPPTPPPTATAPQAPQPPPQQVAPANSGGGGRGDDDSILSQDLLELGNEDEDVSQMGHSQNTLVVAEAAFNGLTSPSGVPPLTQAGSPSAEERKEEEVTADMSQAEVLPRGGDFELINLRLEQESQERRNAAQVTPSILRRAGALRQNLTARFGMNEGGADAVMTEARDEGRESTSFTDTGGGPIQQQQRSERHHNQQQRRAAPTTERADQGLHRMELKKVVSLLTSIFDQIFIKPRSRYDLQVETNNTAFRIFKAEKSLTITEKADKVTEAIQAEGTVSSKVIKVMILDEVRKELAKKKKLEKKKSTSAPEKTNPKTTKAKNKKGAKGGGALPKKSNHKSSARKGAEGSNNATTQGSSNGGPKPTPKNKTKKGKTSKKGKGK
jgi:hypothetical protein